MKTKNLVAFLGLLFISFFIVSCSENTPLDPNLNKEIKNSADQKLSKINDPIINALQYGWKYETDYVFDHYEAKSEFGIWPTEYRQYAGSSGDQTRIAKLNELKSKWGFNYIAANIGVGQNIAAIVSAGFPRTTNYMALLTANQSGRDAAANCCNGLSPSDYFWSYYTDEPYSEQSIIQYDFKNFRDYIKQLRPNSLFGFGEMNVYFSNRYTHNPYFWFGTYFINYNPTSVDFVMCTKYTDYYNNIDQRPLWDELQNSYNGIFSRTWIAAHLDGSEFRSLLGYCRDHGYSPWFYQAQDGSDYNDQMISSYCEAAWLENLLWRYDKQYRVLYKCILNHVHNPETPWECMWVEDSRVYIGLIQK